MKRVVHGAAYSLVILLATVIACGYYWHFLIERQQVELDAARQRGELQVQQINEAVNQQLDATLRSVDIALRQLRTVYLNDRKDFDHEVQDVLDAYPKGMLEYAIVIGPDGYLTYSSSTKAGDKTRKIYLGDREHFRVHAASDADQMFISKPIVGRISGIKLIQNTRPIRRGKRFLGVIGIPIRPEHLSENLWALHVDPGDLIAIVREDGRFIARSRNLDLALTMSIPADRPFMRSRPGERGIYRAMSVADKKPLLFAWRHLSNYPIIAVTGIDEVAELSNVYGRQIESRRNTRLTMALIAAFSVWISILIFRIERTSNELVQSETQFRSLIENSPVGMVAITPSDRRLVQTNKVAQKMWGYDELEFLTKTIEDVTYAEDLAESNSRNEQLATGMKDFVRFEKRYLRKDGTYFWGETCVTAMKDTAGKVSLFIGATIDITARKTTETRVHDLAFNDPLTNLPNRRTLNDRLSRAIVTNKRNGSYGAVMFLDLDNFKPLNDIHGHAAGDVLLVDVANRLRACVRAMDTVARFGGDEFVVVLSELDGNKSVATNEALVVAEKIHSSLAEPYILTVSRNHVSDATIEHHCTVSVGVVIFGGEDTQGDVIACADAAMYQAKELGRNRIQVYGAVRADSGEK